MFKLKKFKEFDIQFVGLKQGKHQFDFEIKQKFFDAFEFEEFNDANVHVDLTLDKKSTCLLYTSDAADDLLCVDLGGRRIIKKKKKENVNIHIRIESSKYNIHENKCK
eukprot:TRINITY_DN8328_c0_g1_i1.p2 TRINITY_DN8328_c0_g1~~TRINITY_DN8328_c0_g1_i1.p2  ORF type:complete len:108 (-),score=24.62 TRINITY_DN8328_c0_g1_i1:40-363(-)